MGIETILRSISRSTGTPKGFYTALGVYVVGALADGLATANGVRTQGLDHEWNVLMQYSMQTFGPELGCLGLKMTLGSVVSLFWYRSDNRAHYTFLLFFSGIHQLGAASTWYNPWWCDLLRAMGK